MTPGPIIDASGITKRFVVPGARRRTVRDHALNFFRRRPTRTLSTLTDVDFHVHRGESVGVMGRNGSGKSTLLKILAGIYAPDAGRVVVRGSITPILELGVAFHPELTVIDNALLLGTVMGLTRRDVHARLDDLLDFSGLHPFADQKVQFLSSGMVARLAYSIAFSSVEEILLLDEVFAVGDAAFRAQCEQRFLRLNNAGHTIVLVSHDPETVARLCTRAVLLEEGRVAAAGPAADVADAYTGLLATES